MNPRTLSTLAASALVLLAGAPALAGPLTPPSGAIAPTMKALDAVEPRRAVQSLPGSSTAMHIISEPGSYYLTGPLTIAAGKNGIVVTAPNVTIDLCGFTISGVPDANSAITANNGRSRITVRNGTIRSMRVRAVEGSDTPFTLERITAADCGFSGFSVGPDSVVDACIIEACGAGMSAGERSTVTDSTARHNNAYGFSLGSYSTVKSCVALGNAGHGFQLTRATHVTDSTAARNTRNGFNVNFLGVNADGSTFHNCSAFENTEFGFTVQFNATVVACHANRNAAGGIFIRGGGTVKDCTVSKNGQRGIVSGGSAILRNTVSNHTHFGIVMSEAHGHVEGNTLIGNDTGIRVETTHTFVAANAGFTGSGPLVENAGTNNAIAPTITRSGSMTNTNPWSNCRYN